MQSHPRKVIESPLAVDELLARAEQGDAECQYWAGLRFFQGEGVPEDPRRGVELCVRAAKQYHVRAITFVAYCHMRGVVLDQDQRIAALLYRFAADNGYAPAQCTLGSLYLVGTGVRKSVRQALRWLGKAAAQGDREALVRLGDLYHEGKDVVEDDGKACDYYRRAADLGSPAGQFMYGSFLMKGEAVPANPVAALELLDQSAAQGYGPACEVQTQFDEFVRFDPAAVGLKTFVVDHPFPIRRRTATYVSALERPCYRAMAQDVYDYVQQYPKDADTGLNDVARDRKSVV